MASAQTGFIAPFDQPFIAGLEYAVDEINAAGGLNGSIPIELDVRDGQSDAGKTVTVAQELVDSGVDFLILPGDGDLAVAGGAVGQQAGIPMMSAGTVPGMTDKVGDYMFGIAFGDNSDAAVLGKYAADQGIKTAFLLKSNDSTYTEDVPDYFAEVFTEAGGEIVGEAQYDLGQQDFSVTVTDIQNLNPQPDIIMTAAYEPDFPAFVKKLRSAGSKVPVWAADAIDTPGVYALGDKIDGTVLTASAFDAPGTPYAKFVKGFTEATGSKPEASYAGLGGDAVKVIDAAVRDAGSTDGAPVRDAIASLKNVQSVTGKISYDYPGSNRMPLKTVYLLKPKDGAPELIDTIIPSPSDIPPSK
ncbi:MAG: ABC transporter substrate-binding protein [Thermoleophilia bacterium]|nr:ABC transporter substrate-binding protein [Thermoleophilia bacterium]